VSDDIVTRLLEQIADLEKRFEDLEWRLKLIEIEMSPDYD